jgi:sulfite exporter TauE/SafE
VNFVVLAASLGVALAGFWNYRIADGFGHDLVAGRIIGDTSRVAVSSDVHGLVFGVIFGMVAGLAATFTACNCVVYAMIPGLVCSSDRASSRRHSLRLLAVFAAAVVCVGALYGLYVGSLGPVAVQDYNRNRLLQAHVTFTVLGGVMLVWAAIALGFLRRGVDLLPVRVRRFSARPIAKAGLAGVLVGLFPVGRPYPVFRDFLAYAATAHDPLYGALVMSIQGLGQIALAIILVLALVSVSDGRLTRWVSAHPHQSQLVSAMALATGGAYFVFYWGIALSLNVGSWGFRLGLYS